MTTAEVKTGESPNIPAPANGTPVSNDVVGEKDEVLDSPVKNASLDRDVALAHLESEKRLSFIKAWEETEKSKVENKAENQLATVSAWENTKKADIEARLRKKEEELEQKKADYAEKMKNKIALIHKEAEEKRALTEAMRAEEILKAEETAAKFRATGIAPKTGGCFG
ncbi:uncharacterized protein At3g61260-like isoform X2 [Impatiens glandulifera]|uniref:uncharacterized protein At3g61260-like isoform X2 n=1 Tax=Impatiens glandulifera TaxID=253017 RepID=UPI001FB19C1A|nr:uncharacterized protein At3g61260-like isoform X2 [Impatiens glandulifera]